MGLHKTGHLYEYCSILNFPPYYFLFTGITMATPRDLPAHYGAWT